MWRPGYTRKWSRNNFYWPRYHLQVLPCGDPHTTNTNDKKVEINNKIKQHQPQQPTPHLLAESVALFFAPLIALCKIHTFSALPAEEFVNKINSLEDLPFFPNSGPVSIWHADYSGIICIYWILTHTCQASCPEMVYCYGLSFGLVTTLAVSPKSVFSFTHADFPSWNRALLPSRFTIAIVITVILIIFLTVITST